MDTPKFGILILFGSLAEAEKKSIALGEIFPAQEVKLVPWNYNGASFQEVPNYPEIPGLVKDWPISVPARRGLMFELGRYWREGKGYLSDQEITLRLFLRTDLKALRSKYFRPKHREEVRDYLDSKGLQVEFYQHGRDT